jgi:hypothetical protein
VSSKLRIRIGEVEIDYEGTEEFLKQELPQLLKTAMELHKASGGSSLGGPGKTGSHASSGASGGASKVASLTTGSIAAKLGAKSGSDLLAAAAAHLALVKNTEPFTRQQLLSEMQSATSYYKSSYSTNLTKYIKTALQKDGPLSETAKNSYALTAAARADLEKKLADD